MCMIIIIIIILFNKSIDKHVSSQSNISVFDEK